MTLDWRVVGRGRAVAGLAVLASTAGALVGCGGREDVEARLRYELLRREKAALEQELARAGDDHTADALVGIPASLVRELLAAGLPVETTVDRFRITVLDAEMDFREGTLALVRLGGQVSWEGRGDVEADVEILGALRILGIDEGSGSLRAGVDILGVRTRDVRVGEASPPAERLVDALADRPAEELQELVREIEVPVRLLQSVSLPAVDEDEVTIAAARVPLVVTVHGVVVGADVLLVELDVDVPVDPEGS